MTLRLKDLSELPPQHREAARQQMTGTSNVSPIVDSGQGPVSKRVEPSLAAVPPPKKRRRFLNQPVEHDGHTFDSKSEFERYKTLRAMEIGGLITNLRVHPVYAVKGDSGQVVGNYEADFDYIDADGKLKVEDVKSPRTREEKLFIRNCRHMEFDHGIRVSVIVRTWKRKSAKEGADAG